jgi:ATP-dependent Lhr-like helicase
MLEGFHPLVAEWFAQKFGEPSAPQAQGWPAIQAGRDTLIAAPTGSGKTLAAFLVCLDRLIRQGLSGLLPDATEVIYVSPLKALSNDIQKNLEEPLRELQALAFRKGLLLPTIRVAVRTGDTSAAERARILRKPPHILVTTPESLYLLVTSDGGREVVKTARTVIVDEIHALAKDKRGAHLSLTLERLAALCPRRPARIGLSATQRPIEEIARFLVGSTRIVGDVPDCAIIDAGSRRHMDVAIELPSGTLNAVASTEQWKVMLDRIATLITEHRSTLVFVNTRRLVERLSHLLEERFGPEVVAAHHGSMSKEARFSSEDRLKRGVLKAVVATASLELGIDVGAVDLVCQVGTARSFSVALQRIGRSGHWKGATPKARLFPMTRDELVESAALVRGLRRGQLEQTRIRKAPLDILAQQIVAAASADELSEDALFDLCRGAYPFAELPRERFDAIIGMLSEGIAHSRGRASAYLLRDAVHGRVKGRRGARLAALTSGGAIPDTASYAVIAEPEGYLVGSLDEHFAVDSGPGDVFLLGNTSWRIQRIEGTTVRVQDAHGQLPTVPFWEGEAPGRTKELSAEVGELRRDLEPLLERPIEARAFLHAECGLDEVASALVATYLLCAKQALTALPSQETLIAERFFDDGGGMQLIIHAPFGARVNRAFGLALRKCFCRSFNFELQAAATDEGILLSLGPQHSFPLESVFEYLAPAMLEEALTQAALGAPMFGVRWRWTAQRSLALLRMQGGKRVPPNIMRMRSDDLLAACFPDAAACQEHVEFPIKLPDHPLVQETVRECLEEAMDFPALHALVSRIREGKLRLVCRDLTEPSPLAHEILSAQPYAFLDDAPLEERRTRAVQTRRVLTPDAQQGSILDAEAIALVREQVFPDPRDVDELHDVLLGLGLLPEAQLRPAWQGWLTALRQSGRAVAVETALGLVHVATERAGVALAAIEGARLVDVLPDRFAPQSVSRAEAVTRVVRGWMEISGPVTQGHLARTLLLADADVRDALLALEAEGSILRGRFTSPREEEWCERNRLARIHRLTLSRLRKEIEPVPAVDFLRFLARWQHAHPGSELAGEVGLRELISQLQGFQLPAGGWEGHVLPARLRGYHPGMLDALCLTGQVVWGRFAPAREVDAPVRSPGLSRVAPLGLALREELPFLLGPLRDQLQRRGACFWSELLSAAGLLAEELEAALWELVAAGEVTSDGFAGLRALIARARPMRAEPRADPLSAGGRWSLLRGPAEPLPDAAKLEWHAGQLLRRYGVVFRDLLEREATAPPWRELALVFRRLEARGELRGGRFVAGFAGEQFALPGAVETLRAVRRAARLGAESLQLSAVDPLNLVGILTPGPRVPAVLHQRVAFLDGVPVTTAEQPAQVG